MALIEINDIHKEYVTYKQEKGFLNTFKGFFYREKQIKEAVKGISFQIEKGEMVGYIGPNGAGKSTTLKILSGILTPTSGEAHIAGIVPYQNRKQHAKKIGVVFGQRTQLWWDLPVIESFELMRYVYRIDEKTYRENMEIFTDLLELDQFSSRPVRQLSLGQRMRADIALSLLHNPDILFLDEPTIGLDVVAKQKIREFIKQINLKRQVTVILTTHDMGDIESLCNRVILIDDGLVQFDGEIEKFRHTYGKERCLVVETKEPEDIDRLVLDHGQITKREGNRIWIHFDRDQVSPTQLIPHITSQIEVVDLTIEEPSIEGIVSRVYQDKTKN
ncbi:ABC transporter ATP-binding protein [Paenibacillus wynnii]|uniref:ABC transporter ATP-binding protein n=1 Tax=Paenibacillus wynnii TaxID=268407 RepID=UPI00278D3EB8|nr:ATP-binding cassette domain-containing protein [Paenibacillus wynnii]MDQ0193763.1 ABC-2 type transport system ATP-binding protein [Paenibacillus wynnii]